MSGGFSVDYLTTPFPAMTDFSDLPSPSSMFHPPGGGADQHKPAPGAPGSGGNSSWLTDSSLLGSHSNLSNSDSAFFDSSYNTSFHTTSRAHDFSSTHQDNESGQSYYTTLKYSL